MPNDRFNVILYKKEYGSDKLEESQMNEKKSQNKQSSLIMKLWKKYVTRELITYAVAGVMTTVVNLVLFHLLCNVWHLDEMIGNIIAWIGAVLFAYIINDIWVFRSKWEGSSKELEKFLKFVGARVASLGVEEAGLLIFVKGLHFNNMIVKAALSVIVILMNYIFSKLFIFTKKSSEK